MSTRVPTQSLARLHRTRMTFREPQRRSKGSEGGAVERSCKTKAAFENGKLSCRITGRLRRQKKIFLRWGYPLLGNACQTDFLHGRSSTFVEKIRSTGSWETSTVKIKIFDGDIDIRIDPKANFSQTLSASPLICKRLL